MSWNVQADQLAEVCKTDALAVTGDFLENREGAPSDWTPTRCRSSASSSISGSVRLYSRPPALWPRSRLLGHFRFRSRRTGRLQKATRIMG